MAAVAKNPSFAKKVGVPRSVGEEFLTADKGKTFKRGGTMKKMVKKMNKGGMAKKMAKGGGVEIKGKTKGKMIAMKKGGMGKAC